MLLLYKSYVRPVAEYCCPLWSPHLISQIMTVEAIQRTFTSKISGMQSSDYWKRLKDLKLFSLQPRRERYAIIMIWKIQHNLAPNCIEVSFHNTKRKGATTSRILGKSRFPSINTMIFNSFSSAGPALFNIVPPHIKAIEALKPFKAALDKWLQSYPDTPPTPGYVGVNNNSISEWASSRKISDLLWMRRRWHETMLWPGQSSRSGSQVSQVYIYIYIHI